MCSSDLRSSILHDHNNTLFYFAYSDLVGDLSADGNNLQIGVGMLPMESRERRPETIPVYFGYAVRNKKNKLEAIREFIVESLATPALQSYRCRETVSWLPLFYP